MAKWLVKPSGSYARAPRRYAVALGCEVEHAKSFVYADQLDLANEQAATPIGISCRICPRMNCDQRAFPPVDRSLFVDPDVRRSEEHTSELQSLMRNSYAVFCLK